MKSFFVAVALIGLVACTKEDSTIVLRPTSMNIMLTNTNCASCYETVTFQYNGTNIAKQTSADYYTNYEYDGSKIIKENFYRNGDDIPWLYIDYQYNHQDRIIRLSYYVNVNSTFEGWTGPQVNDYRLSAYYAYEYNGNVAVKEFYYDNQANDTIWGAQLNYDQNGNLSTRIEYSLRGDENVKRRKYDYTYDNKNHYLINTNLPEMGSLSTKINNLVSETETWYNRYWSEDKGYYLDSSVSTITYSLEYNNLGYPVKITDDNYTITINY
jgi:hypothetical protein